MTKKRREKPFSIEQLFVHKAKPWRKSRARVDGALNTIIRRLKCANASKLFDKPTKTVHKNKSNLFAFKYPFLTRNLEQAFNTFSIYELKCTEYAKLKEQNKQSEETDHAEPIIEFPPEDKENDDDSKSADFGPTTSGLTRWKNTLELMPSPILSKNPKNKHFLNDCSFESVQSLPTSGPTSSKRCPRVSKKAEPQETATNEALFTTLPIVNNFNDSFLQSTPAFMNKLKATKTRRGQKLHSTPKNTFI